MGSPSHNMSGQMAGAHGAVAFVDDGLSLQVPLLGERDRAVRGGGRSDVQLAPRLTGSEPGLEPGQHPREAGVGGRWAGQDDAGLDLVRQTLMLPAISVAAAFFPMPAPSCRDRRGA